MSDVKVTYDREPNCCPIHVTGPFPFVPVEAPAEGQPDQVGQAGVILVDPAHAVALARMLIAAVEHKMGAKVDRSSL